jgi:hypothetical protein
MIFFRLITSVFSFSLSLSKLFVTLFDRSIESASDRAEREQSSKRGRIMDRNRRRREAAEVQRRHPGGSSGANSCWCCCTC